MANNNTNIYANSDLRKQIYLECKSMAEYSLAKGKPVPASAIKNIEAFEDHSLIGDGENGSTQVQRAMDITALVDTHNLLARIIEPALPETVLLLDTEQQVGSMLKFLGPVPLVRGLMLAALISLFIFVALMSCSFISADSMAEDVLNADGIEQIVKLVFYLSASGLGASFAGLYKANYYISNSTFDPCHQTSYLIRFSLGLIAGLLMAVLISEQSIQTGMMLTKGVIRPLLAILGGFSSELLYAFLLRMMETFKSLFESSTQNILDAKAIEAKAKLLGLEIEGRNKLAQSLIEIQQKIGTHPTNEDVNQQINEILKDLMKPK